MVNYAPRISLPYSDLSGVIQEWAQATEKVVVYEHEADSEVSTTHVHMILIDCKYKTPEQLKKIFRKHINTERGGNDLWSWVHKDYPNPNETFIGYMAKKTLRPSFAKNFLPARIEQLVKEWSEPTHKPSQLRQTKLKEDDPNSKLTKPQIVRAVMNFIKISNPKLTESELINKVKQQQPQDVIKIIIGVLVQHDQPLGMYKVLDLYDSFLMYYNADKLIYNCLATLQKRELRV